MPNQFMRQLSRRECDATITLHVVGRVATARCRSLGPGGFEALVNERLHKGQLVYAEFLVAGLRKPVNLCARVTHSDGFLYGFEVVADQQYQAMFSDLLREAVSDIA